MYVNATITSLKHIFLMHFFVIFHFFVLHVHFQKHGSGENTIFQKSKLILTDFHALDVFFVGLNLNKNISLHCFSCLKSI